MSASPLLTPAGISTAEALEKAIRDVPDFPKQGILFKDITPIVHSAKLFRAAVDLFVEANRGREIDRIVGIDARGFLFGAAAAYALQIGFVPIRKKGKLPWETLTTSYALEYGEATVEIHRDAIAQGEKIVLIDDLLATGGTAAAAAELITQLGGQLLEMQFLVELTALDGRARLGEIPVRSFICF